MVNKKSKLLELLGFCIILIALIVYYAVNKSNREQQDTLASPSPMATAEVIVPPVVSENTGAEQGEHITTETQQTVNNNTQNNIDNNAANSNSSVSAKANDYYANLDNFRAEQSENKSGDDNKTQTEIKDGIEVITNPQEGVQ